MSLKGAAAVVGVAELPPQRYTGDVSILDLLSKVAGEAIRDAGFDRSAVDGLIVHPIGGLPGFVPATVAEHLGLQPTFAEVVDLGGATGAGMVWRAAAAIQAGMCSSVLCLTGTRRRRRTPKPTDKKPNTNRLPRSVVPSRDRSPQAEFDFPTACWVRMLATP